MSTTPIRKPGPLARDYPFVTSRVEGAEDAPGVPKIRQGILADGVLHGENGKTWVAAGEPVIVPDSNLWGSTAVFALNQRYRLARLEAGATP